MPPTTASRSRIHRRLAAGAVAAILALAAAACGTDDRPARQDPAPRPAAEQLPPDDGVDPLSGEEVEAVVAAALADPPTAAAVAKGTVTAVMVRPVAPGGPDGPAATVAFRFADAVVPQGLPWEVLCDIGGQTEEWLGVVARVDLAIGAVEGSPLWLTGANCVGWHDS